MCHITKLYSRERRVFIGLSAHFKSANIVFNLSITTSLFGLFPMEI